MLYLPKRFEALLSQDRSLRAAIDQTASIADHLFGNRSPLFFPEYTDHSLAHVEQVLRAADGLIPDQAFAILTAADCAVLVASTIVHDLGMHLTHDAFWALAGKKTPYGEKDVVCEYLDSQSWADLWVEFLNEARCWDSKTLHKLFGTTEPVRLPICDRDSLTLRDINLIGEFIRRNHGRLAHEIALVGFPGPEGRITLLNSPLNWHPGEFGDLTGLIARSHTGSLRSFIPFVEERYHKREYKGVKALYLMGVLRIADYLQIDRERAPQGRLQIDSLRSPLSRREWDSHAAIRNITMHNDDPEALYVDTLPSDVSAFFQLRGLISGLQQEIDQCWAVTGEIYARDTVLRHLGFSLRRVRSNLDDTSLFAQQMRVTYLPLRAAFEASTAELLQLIIQPLYGNDPNVGIRELIQNATDAVRELVNYRAQLLGPDLLQESVKRPDVLISLRKDAGRTVLICKDLGIGMTPDIVLRYFLRAGASYRNSEAWRMMHAPDGEPRVLRSGRFGIGALASFLLGNTIRVSTRHVTESTGVEFSATLHEELIELRRCDREVGTTIEIDLSEMTLAAIERAFSRNDFGAFPKSIYMFRWPELVIEVEAKRVTLDRFVPSCNSELSSAWHELDGTGFDGVFWAAFEGKSEQISCNGIPVKGSYVRNYDLWHQLPPPQLSIVDRYGTLPLSLDRDRLHGSVPFEASLAIEVARDAIALILLQEPPVLSSRKVMYRNHEIAQLIGVSGGFALETNNDPFSESVLEQQLGALLGPEPVLPPDMAKRAARFSRAFSELAPYMQKHRDRLSENQHLRSTR